MMVEASSAVDRLEPGNVDQNPGVVGHCPYFELDILIASGEDCRVSIINPGASGVRSVQGGVERAVGGCAVEDQYLFVLVALGDGGGEVVVVGGSRGIG